MKVLVVGYGSIAKRHLANLKILVPDLQVVLFRSSNRISDDQAQDFTAVYSLDEAIAFRPDFALITNPASLHCEIAMALALQNVHLFIEKPISNSDALVEELITLCEAKRLILMVGYNFRFYEPLQVLHRALNDNRIGRVIGFRAEAGQYLPDWRKGVDYRIGVSARAALGGGALLELSHEFDYARWLIGEVYSVSAETGTLSDLEVNVEDTADVLLRFSNGAIGAIHLDLVQRAPVRTCRVVGTSGTIVWDWSNHCVKIFAADTGTWESLFSQPEYDRNTMYLEEMKHFLVCVEQKRKPSVNGEDGLRTLRIALAAKEAAETRRAVVV